MPQTSLKSSPAPAAEPFPIAAVRAVFPALARAAPFIYFDNAAGAQAPQRVLDAVATHLLDFNVQRGGRYPKSVEVDRVIDEARRDMAMFIGAADPREIAFGMNATSFMRLVSLAIAPSLQDGRDEIIVTDLDHHANISTWLELEAHGAKILWWRMREDLKLHLEDLEALLSDRTRLLACTAASHGLGARIAVRPVADLVHAAGGELFLDAVHFSPHGVIDVEAFGCDYLVCSGYKAFGPHMGFLWGRFEALERLKTFREEFIPDAPPHKIEAGTFIYENVAGMRGAVAHLEAVGGLVAPGASPGRARLVAGMRAIETYEQALSRALLTTLRETGAVVYGLSDPRDVEARVPTVLFNLPGCSPKAVAEALAMAQIGVRDGHMYAPRLMERLRLPMETGAVRASLVHYNTLGEVAQFGAALKEIAKGRLTQ
jgi:cysteine desulfurase family protein (TIGR01976 family)